MTPAADSLSFEEYRERVGRQAARDRDRWFGTDEHREEPLYSAERGMPVRTPFEAAIVEFREGGGPR